MPAKTALNAVGHGKTRAHQVQSEASIRMRISAQMLDLINTAAAMMGKSRTEFMLESAHRQAIDVLIDQRLFVLDDEQHDAFMRALDNPPLPNASLRQLMASPALWETPLRE